MSERADFEWKEGEGGTLLIGIRGEIDHHTAVALRTEIDALLFAHRPRRLVLELSAVSFMDSSGLGLIMGRYGILREMGGELILRDPSPETQTILALAGMEKRVAIQYTAPAGVSERRPSERRSAENRSAANTTSGRTGSPRTRRSSREPSRASVEPRRNRQKGEKAI